jgi:hypothetical protein
MLDFREIDVLDGQDGEGTLNVLRAWFATFIRTAHDRDLDLLTLWCAHTHLARQTYTTPRLLIDSAAPGSGKSTVLAHLDHLCFNPVNAASLSSSALLARLLENEPRTVLIDEVDRTLNPKNENINDLLAILNSGYKRGATRPVLEPKPGGGWVTVEMSTFGPVAMAGNSPNLPPDTRSRCITVLLLPDTEGDAADSDWLDIEDDADALAVALAAWAATVRDQVAADRPDVSQHEETEGLRGRDKERWMPLYKIARAAGGRWPEAARQLIAADKEDQAADKEAGLLTAPRHVELLQDIYAIWPAQAQFWPTAELVTRLHTAYAYKWGFSAPQGELTEQMMGRLLARKFNIRSTRRQINGSRARGYDRAAFSAAWRAFSLPAKE